MNRTLKRPMFRMGGSTGTGITSGLDRPGYKEGTDPGTVQAALDTTQKSLTALDQFREKQSGFMPGALPGFLTSFGLNLLATPPRGNIFQTAAVAAQDPFKTFQAATLAEREDKRRRAEDIFSTALASEYDLERERIESEGQSDDNRKTPEVEQGIIENAQKNIFAARDILKDENSTKEQKVQAERTIKINQNVLVKELGVPAEYAAIISSAELFDAEMEAVVATHNAKQEKLAKDYLEKNPDAIPTEVLKMFPQMQVGTAEARALTIADLKDRFFYAEGGRAGFKLGTPDPMMESVAKQPKGEVQELSYTELRARLPQEISNDIVMLLANSKQALIDFANIQTTEDIASFNQQYDVNLSMPSGA